MAKTKSKKGFFISLEGPDGCGKSTQARLLADWLREEGFDVVHTREPGGGALSEALRRIILDPQHQISPLAELFLYEASRAQHTDEIIRPALEAGKVVVSERYTDATLAYQGFGRRLDLESIRELNEVATGGLAPDLTVVLDIPVEEGLRRARRIKENGSGDRLEREKYSFHARVREGYFAIARREPRRVRIVSAKGGIEEVRERVRREIGIKLKARKRSRT